MLDFRAKWERQGPALPVRSNHFQLEEGQALPYWTKALQLWNVNLKLPDALIPTSWKTLQDLRKNRVHLINWRVLLCPLNMVQSFDCNQAIEMLILSHTSLDSSLYFCLSIQQSMQLHEFCVCVCVASKWVCMGRVFVNVSCEISFFSC